MSEVVEYALPRGWCWASIEELTAYVQRGKSPKYAELSALPVVNQKCVRWHGVETAHLKFVDPAQWDAWGAERTLRDGDILWNSTGTGTIGRAAIYRPLVGYQRVVADSHVTVVRVKVGIPEYLHAWIRSPIIQGRIDAMQTGSTNQVELGRSEVLRTRVPVAPINEQRRIVAKLEALQARSRRAREALDAVPPLLEKLRQSILAAAFRGDLTKDWRAKHKDVEPASELLKRIRAERKKKWEEAELAKMKAKGKAPTDDKWKAKYKEPAPVDTTGLPELPVGWCWASVEELTSHIVDCLHRTPDYVADGLPAVRTADVIPGRLLLSQARRVARQTYAEQVSRLVPEPGDVFYSREGERFGLAALVPEGIEVCISQRMMHFRVVSQVSPGFFMWALNSPIGYGQARRDVGGSTSPHVNIGSIRVFHLPFAPLEEQELIAARIESAWTRSDALKRVVDSAETLLPQLEGTVLAKAFRGELIPQDPNDEPAERMLAAASSSNGIVADGRGIETRNGSRRVSKRREESL